MSLTGNYLKPRQYVFVIFLAGLFVNLNAFAASMNGFDLTDALIPVEEVFQGGPPKDGIASIDNPRFISAEQAKLKLDQRVIGVKFAGQVRAYPINILSRHEVVNDRFANDYVAITYCPLCGSGMVFLVTESDQTLNFGISGLLYNSDVLLYDRATNSLWSQLRMQAVSGPRKGEKLSMPPASHTTWQDWLSRHPETQVLSEDTGFDFDYSDDPYLDYENSGDTWFPVAHNNSAYDKKAWVAGVFIGGVAKAYPFKELALSSGEFVDKVGGKTVRVEWLSDARSVRIYDDEDRELPVVSAYWFAWYGFYPETEIYKY